MLKGGTLKPLFLFISSDSRRKRTKEDCYPQGPLHRGMQHEKSQGPTIFSPFWYRGTRDRVFIWLRDEGPQWGSEKTLKAPARVSGGFRVYTIK